MVPPPRRVTSCDSLSKASVSLATPSPLAPNISGVSVSLPACASARPDVQPATKAAAPPASSARRERGGGWGGMGGKVILIILGEFFIEAAPPVAHHVEAPEVQLLGEEPLRGRTRREIFGGEIVGMNR